MRHPYNERSRWPWVLLGFVAGIVLTASSWISFAHADEAFIKYGVGAFHSADYGFGETKIVSAGRTGYLYGGPFLWQVEVGGYVDDATGAGRRSSGFGFASLGLECSPGPVVLQSLWGAGGIAAPDTMLGGTFEFTQDLFMGLRDKNGASIGLDYKHISSAGIYSPNMGRDFVVVRVGMSW